MFKTKVIFLVSKNITPADAYCFKKVFDNIFNINYKIVNDEILIKEKNELLIWEDIIYTKKEFYNINDINLTVNKKYIVIGNSTNYEKHKEYLEENFKNEILEYENSHTIVFERI